MATRTVDVKKNELANLIASSDREYGSADIVDDGSKVNDLAAPEDGTLSLKTPDTTGDRVLLLNLRYRNEKLYRPMTTADGKQIFIGGDEVQFIDGYLSTDAETAAWVQAVSPYVFVEPISPDTAPFTFEATGFRTWHKAAYDLYVSQYYESVS